MLCVCVNLPTELFLQLQPLKSRHSGYIPKFSSNLNFIFIYYFIFLISGEQSPLLACSIRTGINKDSIYLRRGFSQICTGVKWQDLWRFGNSLWMCGSMGTLVMGTILKRWWETLRNIFAFVKITVNSPFRWWNLALIFPIEMNSKSGSLSIFLPWLSWKFISVLKVKHVGFFDNWREWK